MTTQAAAAETGGDEGVNAAQQELEGRARRMGWRPQDEFRGPADAWVAADVFIDRTMAEAPFLRERNRFLDDHLVKQQRETARLAKVVAEQGDYIKTNIGEIVNRGRRAEAGAFERQRIGLKTRMREAMKAANETEYDRLERELEELEKNPPHVADEEEEERKPAPQPERRQITQEDVEQQISPATKAWIARPENSWFKSDPKLNGMAVIAHGDNVNNGMSEEESLEAVSREIRARYPEKFKNERRETAASVSQPAPPGSSKPKGKTVNDLPPEAQLGLSNLKRLIPGFTDEKYLKEYKW